MHKVKKYIAEDLKFSNQTIKEMKINSKNFYNNIKERRSIREFSKDKIDINVIKNAILSAGSAPSGANLQPWHFVVIKNKTVKKKIRIEAEKEEGISKIFTETGAGQWGSSLAFAGQIFGIDIEVFMVKVSFDHKPYRKLMMQSFGANCHASPSNLTDFGNKLLSENPDNPGSLGIAISEAIEATVKSGGKAKYSLGSVLGHVLMHQTINGNEAIMQMEMAGDYPDIIVGCTGGGSNLSGLMFPFLGQQLRGGQKIDIIGCEPASCPSFTKGKYAYDHGDMAKMTPLIKMHTLGSDFLPPANHSGGLRYHGMSYHLSHLYELGLMRAKAYGQKDCFEAGLTFAKQEGIIPAPEGNHAIKGAIDAALECKEKGESKTILFNLCGHGYFDMSAYDDYLNGSMADDVIDDDGIGKSISQIPEVA